MIQRKIIELAVIINEQCIKVVSARNFDLWPYFLFLPLSTQ